MQNIKALILEDSDKDLEIVYQKLCDDLERPVDMDSARNEGQFLELIKNNKYDVILADYSLPGFNAASALEHVKVFCPKTPFICVSGRIGEDIAVDLLKRGAADYILKDRLGRLSYSVINAIKEAEAKEENEKAEIEKEQINNNLKEAQKIAHLGSWYWDIATNELVCSDEVYNIYGLDKETARLYKNITNHFVSEEDSRRIAEATDAALKGIAPYELEYKQQRPDGKLIYIHTRGKVLHDPNGKPISMTGYMQDITERKRAEEEARRNSELMLETKIHKEKEQEYLEILDGSTDGSFINNNQTKILDISSDWQKRIGAENIPRENMEGYARSLVHPDDRETIIKARKSAISKKLPKYQVEYRYKTADGAYIWVSEKAKLIYDENGAFIKSYGTFTDITERKRTEEALKESEEELLEVLDTVTEGSWVRDIKNGTVKYSDKWMKRVEKSIDSEKIEIKENVFMMLHPEDADKFLQAYNDSVLNRERRFSYECRAKNADGSYSWVLFRTKVNFDIDGTPLKLYGAAIDIDSMKNMELELRKSEKKSLELVRELEEADKNKNQFISVLSHELRNPLASISAGIQVLDLTKDIDEAARVKEIIDRQTKQLCKLVDDLLELTRITQNKIKLKNERINLNEIVKRAVDDIRLEYEKKGVKLGTKIQTRPVILNADPVRITQSIGNLLYNALKFTKANGTVWLMLKTEENNAVISIKDNGIGISPEILPHLFTPFTQADNTLARSGGGLGLGLSIVKGIVDLHEGSVSAYSDGLGKGSAFTIRLPISKEDNLMMEKLTPDNNGKKSLKLLVIEDNKDFADLLSTMLSTIGYTVDIAYDGVEGIKQAKQIKPDVIFCDIGLPGMSGYDVAQSIRNDTELQFVHLVALTGYAGEDDAKRAIKAGFNKYLAKPVDMAALKNLV